MFREGGTTDLDIVQTESVNSSFAENVTGQLRQIEDPLTRIRRAEELKPLIELVIKEAELQVFQSGI